MSVHKVLAILLVCLFAASSDVQAEPPPLPMSLVGAALAAGEPVPAGTEIRAFCAAQEAGQSSTLACADTSCVALDIDGDLPETPGWEGCADGDTVSFTIGGCAAAETLSWHAGLTEGDWGAPFAITRCARPEVSIGRSEGSLSLTWMHQYATVRRFEAYRTTLPLASPGQEGVEQLGDDVIPPDPVAELSVSDDDAYDPPYQPRYYVVLGVDLNEQSLPLSNRTGVFHFELTTGG